MKKFMLVAVVLFSTSVFMNSCKETKKEVGNTESHEGHDHSSDEMAAKTYQCPMDCENGKTYDAEGSCPVCNMDIKEVNSAMEHADGCECNEGGECKCEDGKCSCQAELACTKCEPGECTCKKETAQNNKECTKCEKGSCSCKA